MFERPSDPLFKNEYQRYCQGYLPHAPDVVFRVYARNFCYNFIGSVSGERCSSHEQSGLQSDLGTSRIHHLMASKDASSQYRGNPVLDSIFWFATEMSDSSAVARQRIFDLKHVVPRTKVRLTRTYDRIRFSGEPGNQHIGSGPQRTRGRRPPYKVLRTGQVCQKNLAPGPSQQIGSWNSAKIYSPSQSVRIATLSATSRPADRQYLPSST
jgi:hypothetical protein